MRKRFGGILCVLVISVVALVSWKSSNAVVTNKTSSAKPITASAMLEKYADNIYESAHLRESGLAYDVFKKAITGFLNLKASNKLPQNSAILTVIDFTKSSCDKRMWIIDLQNKELVLKTWVAHGQGSGGDMADSFSDEMDSHKSSLGFYLTDQVYYGKHGRSLKLDGLDQGFNSNARAREIVVHAAGYVTPGTIEALGRLGHSEGCPAVSPLVAGRVIDAIKGKTVIFINGNSESYSSKYLNETEAANFVADSTEVSPNS